MTINLRNSMKAVASTVMAAVISVSLAACATPQQGPMFESTNNAIRAAQTAGALEPDRAQKLLELATAQASLARAISEAAQAESSLGFIRTGR